MKNKTLGSALAWLFALFAVIASFGIGNMTQGNSISDALHATFHIPTWITGIVITVLACNNRNHIICIFHNPRMGISWRKSI
ncbi:alanine:cation symporter family protein [Dorea formicigenerans]|uniref:alanine:cation symporter family protein n=1 Tax=Dorea formicigenerans TaxID=39486 RepID=UPI003B5139A9